METKTADLSSLKIDRSTKSDKPSNKGKYIVTIIVALAIIAAIIILYPIVFSKTIEVKLTSVMLQSTAQTSAVLTASGYVVAQRQASVSSKGTGVMVYLGVVEGDKVKKGQIIARLDDRDIQAQLDEAKSGLQLYQAQLNEVQNSYNREKELFSRGLSSQQNLDQAETTYNMLLANIEIAKARIQEAEVSLENMIIRAPFDGTVLTKNAEVGEIVAPFGASTTSRAAVVTIADMNSLMIEADVSESNIDRIKTYQDCEIVLDAYPQKSYPGYVFKIVPTADRSKATVMVKVGFKEYDSRVLPEMSAKVSFLSQPIDAKMLSEEKYLVVQTSTIRQENGSSVVYKVDNDTAVPVEIKTGRSIGNYTEVISGLEAGDSVIGKITDEIKAGTKVKIVQ
ncbi:MAG: efflux RND transporter periplasmic adaptor subunit [Ignavibacteriota bacterium]|nr:efflux RND transporter periplasmic adaptor subunit [Ignavibacteriales bacterium]MBL1123951.1 efflux RND transporter periplasmic adaptor subunit [Ignavibacteriota bacterium]QKJ94864.1 MAG: efflux RND transporter periplasmic adaptor subunit [Ignavibacteriota bacterium]GIK61948.1 MAG: hemolysin secretion protein D [Ignavibacteriota bacterium]GJQ42789.1 MAG: hemolysin secretion protein D [Ignavibacteriaceae bacterium]